MEKVLEEQLRKWLPEYADGRSSTSGESTGHDPSNAKRQRTEELAISQILDDDDDDVVMS